MASRIVTQDTVTGVTEANTDPASFVQDSDFSGTANGRLVRTGTGSYAVIKDNLAAAVDPATSDNVAQGYAAGSIWVNTTANKSFVAAGESGGNMVWKEVAAGGTGTDCCPYTFQPGGSSTGENKVYNSWSSLYAAASADTQPVTVKIDGSITTPNIPSGSYNFSGWTFKSVGNGQETLVFSDGADVEITSGYEKIKFENLSVSVDTGNMTAPVFNAVGNLYQANLNVVATDTTFSGDSVNNVSLFYFAPAAAGSGGLTIELSGTSLLQDWTVEGDNSSGGTVVHNVVAKDATTMAPATFQGTGNLNVAQRSAYAALASQTSLTGTKTLNDTGGEFVRLVFNESVVGTTEVLVGALLLKSNTTIAANSYTYAGTVAGGSDTAVVVLRQEVGGTEITSWTNTGALGQQALGSNITFTAGGWVGIYLKAGGAAQEALLKGMHLVLYSSSGTLGE